MISLNSQHHKSYVHMYAIFIKEERNYKHFQQVRK